MLKNGKSNQIISILSHLHISGVTEALTYSLKGMDCLKNMKCSRLKFSLCYPLLYCMCAFT